MEVFCLCQDEYPYSWSKLTGYSFTQTSRNTNPSMPASCTTSLSYVNPFQRTLSHCLTSTCGIISVQGAVPFVLESGCKGMAFMRNMQMFSGKSWCFNACFNVCLQLRQRIVGVHIVSYRAGTRVGGRERKDGTRRSPSYGRTAYLCISGCIYAAAAIPLNLQSETHAFTAS